MPNSDRELGLDRPISRRDFIDGVAVAVGAVGLGAIGCAPRGAGEDFSPERSPDYYPPGRSGLRGSHPGSFEAAHRLRDDILGPSIGSALDTGERYDLVIVGAGISGLAAAHFYRKAAGRRAKILLLDNHDDFGGHAKRNEFRHADRLLIGYGGTQSIDSPELYSPESIGLLKDLGIDLGKFRQAFDQTLYASLGLETGVFFDRETFGADRLVPRSPKQPLREFLSRTPLSATARHDVLRVEESHHDTWPGDSSAEKKSRLAKISYRQYLVREFRVSPAAAAYYQSSTHGLYGVGIDAVPALDAWGLGLPGFTGLKLEPGAAPGMNLDAVKALRSQEPYIYHFPDGNASVARLLVRSLLPEAVPGSTMEDVVTAKVDYGRLDRGESSTRIRLNSLAIRVRHMASPGSGGVEVSYLRGGRLRSIQAKGCILACWHTVIPKLCPELPAEQRTALSYAVKVPLIYTMVALRNWKAFAQLGVRGALAPGAFYGGVSLDFPVSLGEYRCPKVPDEPILLHCSRTPCSPGLAARDQHRAGRKELLGMSFADLERATRDQLSRMLSPGGFDPARDIVGLTVNRWPHGYAYQYNSLWDSFWPGGTTPCEVARRPFGRIRIANSDSGAYAYTDAAIDHGYRAVQELV